MSAPDIDLSVFSYLEMIYQHGRIEANIYEVEQLACALHINSDPFASCMLDDVQRR